MFVTVDAVTAPDQPDQPSPGDEWAARPENQWASASIPASGQRPAPYGPDPYAVPVDFAPPPRQPIFDRADLWTVILGTIGVLLVGVIATFVWVWIAPRAMVVRDAHGGVSLVNPETKAFAGADVTYLFVTVAAGLLCALIAAVVARHRGLAVTIAMAGGGVLSSLMVGWCGRWLTGGPIDHWVAHTPVGTHQLFIQLQTRPFVVAWPFVALIVTFVVALATQDREPETAPEASAAQDAVH